MYETKISDKKGVCMRNLKLALTLLLLCFHLSYAGTFSIENDALKVSIETPSGLMNVLDKENKYSWQQFKPEERIHIKKFTKKYRKVDQSAFAKFIISNAIVNHRNHTLSAKGSFKGSTFKIEVKLEGRSLTVKVG
ncbi:MAG: hypothetical protein HQL32_04575, partial [Planctomycetes bacterium]|nr:hypothetical protein [Planctomycetota bacterium]